MSILLDHVQSREENQAIESILVLLATQSAAETLLKMINQTLVDMVRKLSVS
jgi:hypothetical protein